MSTQVYSGDLIVSGSTKFALVAARFNHFIVDRLVEGAQDCLTRHGVQSGAEHRVLVHVPGAFEIPLAVDRLARSKRFDAIIALGAVIRGSTPHFDFVAGEVAGGVSRAALNNQLPIAFGVITTDTIEQAIERAGTKAGNKGWEAAMTALEMVSLGAKLKADGL